MRSVAIVGWLMVPLLVGAYHYGPGQERLKLDDASSVIAQANTLSSAGEFEQAVAKYGEAIALIPADQANKAQRIRLERAKAEMYAQLLPEASVDLKGLVEELEADAKADPTLLADARETLANSQYYLTWLMKLEGLSREDWEPEIEASRQGYRLLAEQAESASDAEKADQLRESLEGVIRLARMDPADLQGLPIPKQCQGCKSGQCKKPGRSPSKAPKQKDGRGASSGPPPDGAGS
jgi:tetratricopeptide (TPR) repeat protein